MKSAIDIAKKSPLRARHGCVIVNKGKIIGCGYNTYSSAYSGGSGFTSIHAEIMAINSIPRKLLKGSIIYVVRLLVDNGCSVSVGNSHPCTECSKKIQKFVKMGIKRVYYSIPMEIKN